MSHNMYNCVYTAVANLFGNKLTAEQQRYFKELVMVTIIEKGISPENLVNFARRANLSIKILEHDQRFDATVKEGKSEGLLTPEHIDPEFEKKLNLLALETYKHLKPPFVLMNFSHAIYVYKINEDGTFSYKDQDRDSTKKFLDALTQRYLIVMNKPLTGGSIVKKIDYQ